MATGNLFSGSFQNQQKLFKNAAKMWNFLFELLRFIAGFKSTVGKEYVIDWRTP